MMYLVKNIIVTLFLLGRKKIIPIFVYRRKIISLLLFYLCQILLTIINFNIFRNSHNIVNTMFIHNQYLE